MMALAPTPAEGLPAESLPWVMGGHLACTAAKFAGSKRKGGASRAAAGKNPKIQER